MHGFRFVNVRFRSCLSENIEFGVWSSHFWATECFTPIPERLEWRLGVISLLCARVYKARNKGGHKKER